MSKSNAAACAFKNLQWLIGKWKAIEGKVTPFGKECIQFLEEFELQPDETEPYLRYTSHSWNAETNEALHGERGYAYVQPNSTNIAMALANSQGLGVVSLEEGCFAENCLELTSVGMAAVDGPQSRCLKRQFRFCGDTLEVVIYMSKDENPGTLHEYLRAKYKKDQC